MILDKKDNQKPIIYAPLKNLGDEIVKIQPSGSLGIVTDQNVADLYLEECAEALNNKGFTLSYYIIPPGEESKNGRMYLGILNDMAKDGLTRSDGLIALGGGVVGDLAGFLAATYMRGINFYQVPTSLLAMVDSSIGGKTGIDLDRGKNLVGAFHMPKLIYQDLDLLTTLPEEDFFNGMAEVIKCGILKGGEFFNLLIPDDEADIPLEDLIKMSGKYKLEIVAEDERDRGVRRILNLGHTFGHAIEKLSDYKMKHGHAVAIGLKMISECSFSMGLTDEETKNRILDLLNRWGYNLDVPFDMEKIVEAIEVDKKREGEYINLIIPKEIGKPIIKKMKFTEFKERLLK